MVQWWKNGIGGIFKQTKIYLMKKNFILILFIAMISGVNAQQLRPMAGQSLAFTPYHDFRLGIGAVLFEDFDMSDGFYNDEPLYSSYNNIIIDFEAPTYYRGMVYTNGIVNANYTLQATKSFGIGISASYISFNNDILDAESNIKVGSGVRNRFALYPSARFTWWRMRNLKLYSEAGLGLGITADSETVNGTNTATLNRFVSAHVTALGVSLGKKIYFYSNLIGVGNGGYFGLGMGYKFDIKK